jgi:CheY-like chemotaxis protein
MNFDSAKVAVAPLSFWHYEIILRSAPKILSFKTLGNQPRLGGGSSWHGCCEQVSMKKMLNEKSILVVDDDQRMLRALDKVLTGEGASVTAAQWAGDALDFLTARETRVDLVITDLRMPFVSGMTVVYAIHKIFPGLPIIVLTAFGSPDVKAECLRQGAAAFMEKPLNTAELIEVIGTIFALHRAGLDPVTSDAVKRMDFFAEQFETKKSG